MSLLDSVLESIFFKDSMKKAGRVSQNAQSLLQIIKSALAKTKNLGTGGVLNLLREKVILLGDFLRAYVAGEYKDVSTKNLLTVTAGLLYFILPLDLIPDLLPVIGYADDIALLTFIVKSVQEELEKFELWQLNKDLNEE